jgi:hypothetical protein
MKATVHMEIDVDTEAWEAEYGTRALEDVENYLLNHLLQSPAAQADVRPPRGLRLARAALDHRGPDREAPATVRALPRFTQRGSRAQVPSAGFC